MKVNVARIGVRLGILSENIKNCFEFVKLLDSALFNKSFNLFDENDCFLSDCFIFNI